MTLAHETVVGRVDKGKVLHAPEARSVHLQNHGCQIRTLDLRDGKRLTLEKVGFLVEPDTNPRRDSPATPRSLRCRGLTDGLDGQTLNFRPVAEAADSRPTGGDDETEPWHRDRGLGNVSGQHDAPLAPVRLEHLGLANRIEPGVQHQHIDVEVRVARDKVLGFADLTLPGKKDQ